MKVSNKFRRPERSGECGVTMVLVAMAMVAIIAMAAMSIDLVTLYLAREEAQRSADAAALAAARVISVSGITGAGAPSTNTTAWSAICGAGSKTTPAGVATQAAQAVGGQNSVGGAAATVNVSYSVGSNTPVGDCSTLGAQFAVNPLITVQVQRQGVPTFFSRLWGITGNNISATAVAEAFNSSGSNVKGNVTPVQPRCVKPWMAPNIDPGTSPPSCIPTGSGATCTKFISLTDGTILNPGVSPGGVIGETFNLFADCGNTGTGCSLQDTTPRANVVNNGTTTYDGNPPPTSPPPNLEYLAGASPASAIAVPSLTPAGIGGNTDFEPAVAGCDHTTVYKCGVANANVIDLSENPGGLSGDTSTAIQLLIGQSSGPTTTQDVLNTASFPFTITAGSSNPIKPPSGSFITSSNSIVSLPIYDQTTPLNPTGTTPVTIVGYLQVFINQVNGDGSLNVTVLNVAGCGSDADNPAVTGSSPVPIRLVTPQ